jgi:hypothetical protein
MDYRNLKPHPLAALFPKYADADLKELTADIKTGSSLHLTPNAILILIRSLPRRRTPKMILAAPQGSSDRQICRVRNHLLQRSWQAPAASHGILDTAHSFVMDAVASVHALQTRRG